MPQLLNPKRPRASKSQLLSPHAETTEAHALQQGKPPHGLPCPPAGDLPNSKIKPRALTLLVNSSQSEPPGKPKNTEAGSLSLLQAVFPTKEWNQGLLHCRRILYQLSRQGSPLRNQCPWQLESSPHSTTEISHAAMTTQGSQKQVN